MKNKILQVMVLLALPACTHAKPLEPWTDNFNEPRSALVAKEAQDFIIRRQGCDHFRGEPGYDEERQKFLDEQIKETCSGSDAQLKKLRAKYANQPETMKALAEFEDCIEYETRCVTKAQD